MSTTTEVVSVNGLDSSSTSSSMSIRATKRKFDDALQSLDNAVAPAKPLPERPTAPKRPHMTRSLYSTLAKYGIQNNIPKPPIDTLDKHDISKAAPHLAAILARSKSKGATPFAHPSIPASASLASEYRPSSTQSFLSRLSTYKLATYANKPPQIDAVAAAKCGWINDGKDRLVCGICDVSWVVAGRDGMTREAANVLVEKQRIQLVEMHKDGCPWHTRQCDSSIYRVPLQAPAAMARDIKFNALALEPLLTDVVIKHPLSASQLASLRLAIASVKPQAQSESENESAMHIDAGPEPSDTAIVTALFGWSLAPPAPPLERNRTSSVSRMATMSRPASPSLSRSSSVSRTVQLGRADLPSPRPSSSLTSISRLGGTPLRTRMPRLSDLGKSTRDTSLLHCSLCQRRVGLWAFTLQSTPSPLDGSPLPHPSIKKRQFDVLNEHRSYCPFVAPSTVVPKLPMPSTSPLSASVAADSVIEGWRAVLTVVLRHGLSERQRNARLSLSGGDHDGIDDELEGVEAMVAGVKSKGGRELLKYVKGLLG
ncbi:C3HC zinc finger-like-domain-containing protein [Suillus cothurnatus]|nr:C3HC zinc finger-like-domain-containing protein [Suillus cothurnatus]